MMKTVLLLLFGVLASSFGGITNLQRNGEANRYFLYTRSVTGEELTVGSTSTNFDKDKKTVVLVHGHGANYQSSLNPDLIRLLRAEEDLNIIAVDWSSYAVMSFTLAENAVPSVAFHLASFLESIDFDPALTHLIGFHLGAHVVGIAGRRLGGIARITGLDPAKSLNRLAKTDANYVEVIHTDSVGVLSNGSPDQMGDADFYPNGGGAQPGCLGNFQCNHDRAWLLFAASISGTVFNANCCNTIQQKNLNQCHAGVPIPMGNNDLEHKMPCASGIYRVNTGSSYPF